MESWTNTAQSHLTDWTGIHWAVAIALLVLALLASFFPLAIMGLIDLWHNAIFIPVGLIIACGTLFMLAVVPGSMMRHFEQQRSVLWVLVPCLAAAVVLWLLGLDNSTKWLHWVPAALLAIGTIAGAISDQLQRLASTFPTSVVGLLVAGAVIVALFFSSTKSAR